MSVAGQEVAEPPAAPPQAQRLLPVHIDLLDPQVLDMDLWLQHDGQPQPALYRAAGLEITLEELQRLKSQRINHLYVPAHQHATYRRVLVKRLDSLFADRERIQSERVSSVRENCSKVIEGVMMLPGQAEPIDAVTDICRVFRTWVEKDEGQFGFLLAMSAHDFYTTTHMVNVGVGCGLLVRAMKPNDESLFAAAVQGGLLHDIGMRDIPLTVLHKSGRLEPHEWEALRRHPAIGYEELKECPGMPQGVLEMVRDHHERLDGKGYPSGLFGEQVGFLARVCAVVDVFDTITAGRPGRPPVHPRDALKMMAEGGSTQFDAEVLEAWRALVIKLLEADASRVGDVEEGVLPASIADLLPRAPGGSANASHRPSGHAGAGVDERRRYVRFACNTPAMARFVEQSRAYSVKKGQPFDVQVVDISRGGLCAEADWPFAKGELLHFTIPGPHGRTLSRYARVVRVRGGERGKWLMGLSFAEPPAE